MVENEIAFRTTGMAVRAQHDGFPNAMMTFVMAIDEYEL